jgi:DNA invertase Pin-like site-specific DNA recombinase
LGWAKKGGPHRAAGRPIGRGHVRMPPLPTRPTSRAWSRQLNDGSKAISIDSIRASGCSIIRAEKVSGTSTEGREELNTVLQFLRQGDTLVVTRIDRLARSIRDLQNIVYDLKARGVTLKATEQPIDTSTVAGKCFLDMLGVFAEFETNLRRERQLEGIAKAKAEGIYKGRKATIDRAEIRDLKAQGLGVSAIAEKLDISRMSVYRALSWLRRKQLSKSSANSAELYAGDDADIG